MRLNKEQIKMVEDLANDILSRGYLERDFIVEKKPNYINISFKQHLYDVYELGCCLDNGFQWARKYEMYSRKPCDYMEFDEYMEIAKQRIDDLELWENNVRGKRR